MIRFFNRNVSVVCFKCALKISETEDDCEVFKIALMNEVLYQPQSSSASSASVLRVAHKVSCAGILPDSKRMKGMRPAPSVTLCAFAVVVHNCSCIAGKANLCILPWYHRTLITRFTKKVLLHCAAISQTERYILNKENCSFIYD